ncbi:hypothetical protein D3C79_603810 [compost metagenome]
MLERVGGKEVVRRLHQGHFRVLEEPADGQLQERPHRDMVAVEHRDQIAGQLLQRVVEVTCLGAAVIVTVDVADPDLFGERPKRRAGTVIKDKHLELVARPVEAEGGHDRGAHH